MEFPRKNGHPKKFELHLDNTPKGFFDSRRNVFSVDCKRFQYIQRWPDGHDLCCEKSLGEQVLPTRSSAIGRLWSDFVVILNFFLVRAFIPFSLISRAIRFSPQPKPWAWSSAVIREGGDVMEVGMGVEIDFLPEGRQVL